MTSRHVAAGTDAERLARGNAEADACLTDQQHTRAPRDGAQPAVLGLEQAAHWLEIPSDAMTPISVAVVATTAPFAEPDPKLAPKRRADRAPYPDKR